MFKVDNREIRSSCNICLKLTIEPPKRNRKIKKNHSNETHVQLQKPKYLEQCVTMIVKQQGCQEMSF